MIVRLWISRVLVGLVFFFNFQCALAFLLFPEQFAPGFELNGVTGSGIVRGFGILFLMWNVPYAVALKNPERNRVSLREAIAMQAIGFAGEAYLLAMFPPGHALINETVGRFILFDGAGLVALLLAGLLVRESTNPKLR